MNKLQSDRRINPWLRIAAEIQLQYFGEIPTILSFEEIRDEIIRDHSDELTLFDMAMVLLLVKDSLHKLHLKSTNVVMA